jgi:hypothetical protein
MQSSSCVSSKQEDRLRHGCGASSPTSTNLCSEAARSVPFGIPMCPKRTFAACPCPFHGNALQLVVFTFKFSLLDQVLETIVYQQVEVKKWRHLGHFKYKLCEAHQKLKKEDEVDHY